LTPELKRKPQRDLSEIRSLRTNVLPCTHTEIEAVLRSMSVGWWMVCVCVGSVVGSWSYWLAEKGKESSALCVWFWWLWTARGFLLLVGGSLVLSLSRLFSLWPACVCASPPPQSSLTTSSLRSPSPLHPFSPMTTNVLVVSAEKRNTFTVRPYLHISLSYLPSSRHFLPPLPRRSLDISASEILLGMTH